MSSAAGPSQFAQLLKRSKFATYDPSVAQIYTTYGGYAHRGDYGLKRPLPASARGKRPYVIVKAVDSSVMQTEWSTAQAQGRWMRRFDETGASARARFDSKWGSKGKVTTTWEMESSFNSRPKGPRMRGSDVMVPNLSAMTDAEFDSYLEHLRTLRPQFKRFYINELELEAKRSQLPSALQHTPLDLGVASRGNDLMHREFLQTKAKKETLKPRSTIINPMPHPNAGLSYTEQTPTQRAWLYPSVPGRIVDTSVPGQVRKIYKNNGLATTVVAVGGTLASFHGVSAGDMATNRSLKLSAVARDFQPVTHGEIAANVDSVSVMSPPNVVGKHNGLGGTEIGMSASEAVMPSPPSQHAQAFNPHRPGTREYAGYIPPSPLKTPLAFNAGAYTNSKSRDVTSGVKIAHGYIKDLTSGWKKAPTKEQPEGSEDSSAR